MCASKGETVLEARQFSKSYGQIRAVRDISFSVGRGEIFGLIGPDGGGKTSLIRSFVGLLPIEAGELFFQGRSVGADPEYVRSRIGYMPQHFSLYQDLTVKENLLFFADLFDVNRKEALRRMEELFLFSGLKPFVRRKAGALSGGMKQKLALSCMLIHSPDIIILDEPTFGVDPLSRNDFWQILARLKEEGTTILVSTAYMDEAGLCDRVGLIFKGRLLASDEPEGLKKSYPRTLYRIGTSRPHLVQDSLEAAGICDECHLFGEGVHVTFQPGRTTANGKEVLERAGLSWDSFDAIEAGMEDLFLKLMKETGDE